MSTAKTLDNRVYNHYRLVLKNLRGGRASTRKQRARVLTSERYHLPISQVKQVVRDFDEKNGVTHEHPVSYLRQLEADKLVSEAQAEYDANPVPCHCGSTELVRARLNPFEVEIHEQLVVMVTCYMCYRDAEYDI